MLGFFRSKLKKVTSFFSKIKFALGGNLKKLLSSKRDDAAFEELEQLFFESDLGSTLSLELVEEVKQIVRKTPDIATQQILEKLKEKLLTFFITPTETPFPQKPYVIMMTGTNGSGKTTTIAKLAYFYKKANKKVLLAAGDTFRAAAMEQLANWAKKISVDIVLSQPGADPAAVAFDSLQAAKARGSDIVLIDTAGRLHTKTDLMQELEKIKRVCKKFAEEAPHETLLVLDATTGQNALDQARMFHKYTPISSIVLTKLDGSAKGGVVLAIQNELKIPVSWVGTGEGIEDIAPFEPEAFIDALLSIE